MLSSRNSIPKNEVACGISLNEPSWSEKECLNRIAQGCHTYVEQKLPSTLD